VGVLAACPAPALLFNEKFTDLWMHTKAEGWISAGSSKQLWRKTKYQLYTIELAMSNHETCGIA
jgi:hypothetical protein